MNGKKFEYQSKDIPLLRKDMFVRFIFLGIFLIPFLVQLLGLILVYMKGSATVMMVVISSIVMLVSLMFAMVSMVFAFKDMKLIQEIKKNGNVITSVSTLPSIEKRSFVRLYSIIIQILSIVCLLVLVCAITYSVLQFTYFKTTSFYLPLLLLFTIIGFNAVYHVKHEIQIISVVKNFINSY